MHSHSKYIPQQMQELSGTDINKCMKCGRCSAACPTAKDMDIMPHQFISHLARGDVSTLLNSNSLWQCLSCFACVQRCPRGVMPANLIEAARLIAIRPKGAEHLSVEEAMLQLEPDMPQQLIIAAFRKYS
ncbi:MAG: 4Fe-4S dicluster domain-containing protein [Defluviitaleaceae bacterium]|nr:4Fe-4S dicluster domain-containing protein [Defluviitaleaceae bacterium]